MNSPRIVLFTGIVAMAAAGMMAGNRWHAPSSAKASATEVTPILDRHVGSVHLHGVPADEVIPKLQELIGVKIVPQWDAMEKAHVDRSRKMYLDFTDIPVGQLMRALTEQMRGYHGAAGFDLQGDTIVIAPDPQLKQSLRVYDVADLVGEITVAQDATKPGDDLNLGMRFCLEQRYWFCGVVVHAEGNWLHQENGRLLIMQTAAMHNEIETFLAAMRQARADGTGLEIARSRVIDRKSFNTVVRFYDVRDLVDRAEYLTPDSGAAANDIPRIATGGRALCKVVSWDRRSQSWDAPAQVICVMGRLIVEQTPTMHAEVHQMLTDIRAGKPLKGFRLTSTVIVAHDASTNQP